MKNRPWIRSPFVITLLIAVIGLIILACGDLGDDDYYPASFFPPEITHSDKYAEFFCTPHSLYVSNSKDSYIEDFNSVNIDEWNSFFQKEVKGDDLQYLLYKARPGEIDTLIFSIKKSGYSISRELKNNSILKAKDTRAALDFLYYVGFAKRCEKYATFEQGWYQDYNDPNDLRKDKTGMSALADAGLKQMNNPKNDFVKQRYVFQLLRLYYLSKQYDKCIDLYTKQKSLLETNANSMKYRAMGYAAGAYYGLKQFGEADYLYSLIYADNEIMRISAYFSFHPQEEKDWNQTLALAKNPKEKEFLWAMLGTYKDPFRALKEVYSIDPKSELLDLLLARAVNTDENNFIIRFDMLSVKSNPDSTSSVTNMNVNKDLLTFVKMVADKGNTAKPYEWNMAAGYLTWASGDKNFQPYLDKAKSEVPDDTLVNEESRLIVLLDKINRGKAGDWQFEKSLVPQLIWLELSNHAQNFPRDFARQYILSELNQKYAGIGDSVKAMCFACANKEPLKQDADMLNEIEEFINKKNKTTFEQYVLNVFPYTEGDIVDMQATILLYQYKFKQAAAKLDEDTAAGNETPYGDPFQIHINDCHDCDNNGYSLYSPDEDGDTNLPIVNSKRDFINEMARLESKIKSNPANKTHKAIRN